MNVDHIKLLRESYMTEATNPDGRKTTTGEYMRFITDCNLEFVTSKDLVITDDDNGIVHCICLNEDMVTQASFPVKVISAAYEDIHAVEAIISKDNFENFINNGYLSDIINDKKKEFILRWCNNIKIQSQQPVRATPYYTQTPTVHSLRNTGIKRHDGITNQSSPATLAVCCINPVSNTAELVNAIKNGGNIEITKNIDLDESITITKDTTINLNGNTISSIEGKRAFVINGGNVVIKNGNVRGIGNDAFFMNGIIKDGGSPCTLTLDNDINVVADDCCILLKGPDTVLNTCANLTSTGAYAAIQGNGSHGNIIVNITGGTIISNDVGVYFPCKTMLNISGNTIIKGTTGIYHKSGILNISENVAIYGIGDKVEYTYNPNGCNSTGDAVVIEACDYPDGVPSVNISGGLFDSLKANSIGYYRQNDSFNLENTKFITGGTFVNFDPSNGGTENPNENFVTDGYYVEQEGNNYIVKKQDV